MLEEAIFNEITGDSVLATKLQNGSSYNVYPSVVPTGVLPNRAIAYTEITQSLTYPLVRTSLFQFNCFAPTALQAIDLANDLDRIFNDLSETMLGGVKGVKYVKFVNRTMLFNAESGIHQCVVELMFKY